jgi:hypothetical protein
MHYLSDAFSSMPLDMKERKTPTEQAARLTFKTSQGTLVLPPDRLVYLGYRTGPDRKRRMELAYFSHGDGQLCVEHLAYRSLTFLSLPDHGPVMRIHRQLFINIEQVRHYDKDLRITLHPISDYCFKVGRTFRKAFLRALGAS